MADVAAFLLGGTPVVALGFAEGGYFPEEWAWATLGLSWAVIVVALLVRDLAIGRRPLIYLGLLTALGLWMAASLVWTRSTSLTVPELQRLLVYVAGVGAAVLVVGGRRWRPLVGGVWTGLVAVVLWGLADYLLRREAPPAAFEHKLLYEPMGYANGMGIAAVLAIVLALGVVVQVERRLPRIVASMVLVPLVTALALTGSRAAWVALFVGTALAISLLEGRQRALAETLVVAVVPLVAVGAVVASDATSTDIAGARADRLGERLLFAVVVLTIVAAFPALVVLGARARRAELDRRLLAGLALVVLLIAAIGVSLAKPGVVGDRPTYWRVALEELSEHPVLGTGAGSYAQVWLERRPNDTSVRDAHSIVVEFFSELGPIGLALICAVLIVPLAWGVSARRTRFVPWISGAVAAFGIHASFDWDWELPAVTIGALFCAVALAAATDESRAAFAISRTQRGLAIGVGVIVGVAAFFGALGARTATDAAGALERGDAPTAERQARRAARLQPWSIEPLLIEGQAALAHGDRARAREAFLDAIERDRNDYRAWLALAAVSEPDEAELALLRAQQLNPRAVASP